MMGRMSARHSPGSGRGTEIYTHPLREDLGGQPSIASHRTHRPWALQLLSPEFPHGLMLFT